MGLEFRDLDEQVRALMVEEIMRDVTADTLYHSSYFNDVGNALWRDLLIEAAANGNDDSLAEALANNNCFKSHAPRVTKKGTTMVAVPVTAPETTAESNFSRFYIRALCVHAINIGKTHIIGYRAKYVETPRSGSEEKIGALFPVAETLIDVRQTMHNAPTLGMPPGPNSGILAHL